MSLITTSQVLLWGVIAIQSLIIYALIRQVGVLFERIAPAGALAMNQNLEVGQKAPELSLQTLTSKIITIGGEQTSQKSTLLFFLSPDCPICKTLLPALTSAIKAESHWLSLVLASDDDKKNHQSLIKQYNLDDYPYVVSELLGKTYGVAKLPYAVLVDEKGYLASMGIVNSREHLDSLFEAKERKVSSIQAYMADINNNEEYSQQVQEVKGS